MWLWKYTVLQKGVLSVRRQLYLFAFANFINMETPALSSDLFSPTSMCVLVLITNPQLPNKYQHQLLAFTRVKEVQQVILVGKHPQELPQLLANEPKLKYCQIPLGSLSLMAEAGAFEAQADVLVLLKQGVWLQGQTLREICCLVASGYHFGGLIPGGKPWWFSVLKKTIMPVKGLAWFRLSRGYFVSRKLYQLSGGFKYDGKEISFYKLLSKQEKRSRYSFLFYDAESGLSLGK